jgi:DUF4097 and DUF4098 domain-containing protein YvlB
MRRLVIILTVGLTAALAAAGCTSPSPAVTVVHDQVYPASGLAVIDIEHQNGMVDVTGWDREEIQVRVLEGRRVDSVSVETAGDRMTVRTLPTGVVGINGPQARYEVSVPRSLKRIEVRTSNGQIQVANANGTVAAETSNGAIRLTGTRTIERLSSSNGAIDAEVRALDTDARVTTSNGAIRLALAPTLNAVIEARTSNGRVTASGIPLTTTAAGPAELRGTLGAGGPLLSVETSNGAITMSAL